MENTAMTNFEARLTDKEGSTNDFTKASSLTRAAAATKTMTVQISGLVGTNRTYEDLLKDTETNLMETTINGLEDTTRMDHRSTGHSETQNADETNNGLDGTTGINNVTTGQETLQ